MHRIIIPVILLAFCATAFSAPEKLWVSSSGAKLKAERKASSETVAKLPVGTELKVISYKKKWYEVSTDSGKKGWIYRGKVSDTPPEAEEDDGMLGELAQSGIKADAADDSRSIRGLSPEAKEYADSTGTKEQYRKALEEVLARKTAQKDVERFLKDGKIGEFAE